jgi:Raf kinase inhibitor-like YbhB/YbcL family protein
LLDKLLEETPMPSPAKRGFRFLLVWIAASLILPATGWSLSKMEIHSGAFTAGNPIPSKYTCSGENISPLLSWTGVPRGTKSLALIVDDPDAPSGTFVHWVVYNLPPETTHLNEAVTKSTSIPGGGMQGRNDFGKDGYGGPCPPRGKLHHYRFLLYALNSRISPAPATGPAVEQAMKGHILAFTDLIGIFGR